MINTQLIGRFVRGVLNKVEDMPRSAQIEITNLCNLKCKMCFRHFLDLDIKHMDIALFKQIVDSLEGVEVITPSGYGEPLCHPDILEAIAYCKSKGHTARITSNGLLLKDDDAIRALVETGLDAISFSVEDIKGENEIGHPNHKALKNISRLVEVRDAMGASTPVVTLQTLMLKGKEQDVLDIIDWAVGNGIERVNVARFELNTLQDVERLSIEEEKSLFRKFDALRKEHSIQIDCLQDRMGGGVEGLLYKYFKPLLRMDDNCIRIRDFVHIGVNGEIRPCCALTEIPMGKLPDDDLHTIWHSEKYRAFRKNYANVPWCKGCDFARERQVDGPGIVREPNSETS